MSTEDRRPKRIVNKTFRLELEASRLLSREAGERNISVNELINQLILKNLKARRGLNGLDPMLVPATSLKLLLEDLSDQRAVEIGERVANDVLVKHVPFEVAGNMSRESVLDVMKLYHNVTETTENGKKVAIMAHYAGRKFSLFVGASFRALFAQVGANVSYSPDENAVVFEFV